MQHYAEEIIYSMLLANANRTSLYSYFQAYIGVLCETVSSTGFSSINNGLFLTLAHEIGHNFNARHTFETCTQDGTANST